MQGGQNILQNGLSSQAIRACGFEVPASSSLPHYLYQAQLNKRASCSKDAIIVAIRNFQRLQNALIQNGTVKKWKFYHVIFCSMADYASKNKIQQTVNAIIQLSSAWKVASFKTFIIPITMAEHDLIEIKNICSIGGPDWTVFPSTNFSFGQALHNVMKEVDMKMNINQSFSDQLDSNPYDTLSTAVTFSVEASQNLAGQKWQGATNAICNYIRNLSNRDLVSGILFSTQPWVVGQVNYQPPAPAAQRNVAQRDQQQYQVYVQPVVVRQGNAGRNCGYCCIVLFILFIIRLILYLAVTS